MIKKLLVVFAAGALISVVCFTVLHAIGGFPPNFAGRWNYGGWEGRGARPDVGPEVTRDLPFNGAARIDIGYPAEITYTQGPQAKFTVTGPQFILDQLRLQDGDLTGPNGRDGPRFGWGRRFRGRLRIDIVSPNTEEFHLAGAQKLSLRNFDQDALRLYTAGAADIDGQGRARRLEVDVAGAGHLDLGQLPVSDARVAISGAGDAEIDPRASADVSISGAGHVRFRCRPPVVSSHISGFGSVDQGPDCSTEPPPASSAPPAAPRPPAPQPPAPQPPAPKSNV